MKQESLDLLLKELEHQIKTGDQTEGEILLTADHVALTWGLGFYPKPAMKQESDVIERFDKILQSLQDATKNKAVYDVSNLLITAALLTLAETIRTGK